MKIFVPVVLLLSFFGHSLYAQGSSEPIANLLNKSIASPEVKAWVSAIDDCKTFSEPDDEVKAYICLEKGRQIVTEFDYITSISVFADVPYGNAQMKAYQGELPYGLKMSMTRAEVESIMGNKPDDIAADHVPGKRVWYFDQNIVVQYNMSADKVARPEDKIWSVTVE